MHPLTSQYSLCTCYALNCYLFRHEWLISVQTIARTHTHTEPSVNTVNPINLLCCLFSLLAGTVGASERVSSNRCEDSPATCIDLTQSVSRIHGSRFIRLLFGTQVRLAANVNSIHALHSRH